MQMFNVLVGQGKNAKKNNDLDEIDNRGFFQFLFYY